MKETFFRSMTWLHTWAGLAVCWLLLLIFFAGSLSYFRHEISLWSKPELHQAVFQDYDQRQVEQQITKGQAYLADKAPDAASWTISFPSERKPYLSFGWADAPKAGERRGKFHEHVVNQDGQQMITDIRDSRGGNFFYRLHFDLHYLPVVAARWIVGLATMAMLIALISGVVIHKRLFKDFFSFRPAKGSRSWLDAHNVSAVMALPYHLIITYTGLITLMFMFMPWGALQQYDGDVRAFRADLNPARIQEKPGDTQAPLFDAARLVSQVERQWGIAPLKQVSITGPGRDNSRISFTLNSEQTVTDRRNLLVFDGVTGELKSLGNPESVTYKTYDTLMSLHTARFADWALRGLFFLCGLLGCAMVATGTLLWAVKIAQKQQKAIKTGARPSIGLRLVDGLNISFICGLPLATAGFFYANRLLPVDMVDRAQREVDLFFITLAVIAIVALWDGLRCTQSWRRWRQWLALSALAFAALPLLGAVTSGQSLLSNMADNQWTLVGFDMISLLSALALGFAARQVSRTKLISSRQGATSRLNSKSATPSTANTLTPRAAVNKKESRDLSLEEARQ
ncbi:PepSY-associated TM helix domain-containing protein [Shewanella aquimarina]|uniref:PepSY-associated TM helix domain-containing protein n=1 Tax=Shewanella aquimarina TaxID=260365 RepID=UPI002014E7B7|nr:PepSY-associated TM helix domain-containing protein [Shewanella aquimarina]MCL2910520.1 PepSY domain-containing protein [Shewanella aquimarina]